MVTEHEGTFKVGDVDLYTKTWTPTVAIKAKVVFIHGFSDHINRYYELFPTLAAQGIQVYGFDQRGWGRSVRTPSDKGLTGPTSLVLSDIAAFIKDKLSALPDVPLFVMGHSMGGGEVLTLASDPGYEDLVAKVRGWILEAPFLAFTPGQEPSALKVMAGKLASRFLPHMHLLNKIPVEHLTRDPEVQKSLDQDTLLHDTGTLEGLAGLLERTGNLSSGKVNLLPCVKSLFAAHGSEDKVTCHNASKRWFENQKVEDGRFKSYEGHAHQLHSDYGRERFYDEVAQWILERVPDLGGKATAVEETPGPTAVEEPEAKAGDVEEAPTPDAKL